MARALAALAIPLFAFQAWTLAGWLADGPHQITAFRDSESFSWQAARVIEVVLVVVMVLIAAAVVHQCRSERRLSFDAMLVIGLTSAAFWDPIYNWITPAWLYSANWINLDNWLDHAPLILNPVAGEQPWAVGPTLLAYSFWLLGFAVLVNAVMRRVAHARPGTSDVMLASVAFVLTGLLTVGAFGIFKALDLMAAPGYRTTFLGGSEWPFIFWTGGLVFGAVACLRYFRDRNGLALTERGLGALPPKRRSITALAATVAACQIIVVLGWGLLSVPFSLYSEPYPQTPAHLLNGLCDVPPAAGSDYGPCPGSPGFAVPLR